MRKPKPIMKWNLTLALLAAVLFVACAAPRTSKMNNLSLGMAKAEVIRVMGQPDTVAATDGVEYLTYRLATSLLDTDGSDTSDYFVQIKNGLVSGYGKRGDFGTTAPQTQRIEVEQRIDKRVIK